MEETLSKAIMQAPALAVLVFLVVSFLKHLRAEGESNRTSMKMLHEAIEREGANNRAALNEVTVVVRGIIDDD